MSLENPQPFKPDSQIKKEISESAPKPESDFDLNYTPEQAPNSQTESPIDQKTFKNADFNAENKNFFSRMTEGAKNIASRAYEGVYKTPGISRIVAKIEIAHNRNWADSHEKKAGELADSILLKNKAIEHLAASANALKSQVESLKKQGLPTSQLEIQIKKIDYERGKMLNKRDKLQTRFEERENKVKIYTNERDRVADKLINRYEAVLGPMEEKIEAAKTARDEMNLKSAVMEARHKQEKEKISEEKSNLEELKDVLRMAGLSDRKINKSEAVRTMRDRIDTANAILEKEREDLEQDLRDNERYIADLDKHANPFRDKRDEFARIKQERPIEFSVAERKKEWKPEGKEESSFHTRTETTEPPIRETSSNVESKIESSQEDKERPKVGVYLVAWHAFLAEKLGGEEKISPQERSQTPEDFIKATGLDKDFRLDRNGFKKILLQYYKYKKLPTESLVRYLDEFLKQEEIKLPEKQA